MKYFKYEVFVPHNIVSCQETVVNNIKTFILTVCVTWNHFLENTLQIFVILNYILDNIYNRLNDLITSLVPRTNIFYSGPNWNYIAAQLTRREPRC